MNNYTSYVFLTWFLVEDMVLVYLCHFLPEMAVNDGKQSEGEMSAQKVFKKEKPNLAEQMQCLRPAYQVWRKGKCAVQEYTQSLQGPVRCWCCQMRGRGQGRLKGRDFFSWNSCNTYLTPWEETRESIVRGSSSTVGNPKSKDSIGSQRNSAGI